MEEKKGGSLSPASGCSGPDCGSRRRGGLDAGWPVEAKEGRRGATRLWRWLKLGCEGHKSVSVFNQRIWQAPNHELVT